MFSPATQLTFPIRVGLDSSAGSWSLGDTVPPSDWSKSNVDPFLNVELTTGHVHIHFLIHNKLFDSRPPQGPQIHGRSFHVPM